MSSVDRGGAPLRNCFGHQPVFVRECQLLPSQTMLGGSVGGGSMTSHCSFTSFLLDDHEFSVVLRPIVMVYFQPHLWFHALQKQKRFVFITYLHFASCFFFRVLILSWPSCVCGGQGVSWPIYMILTERLSHKHGFCLHVWACGKLHALDQVGETHGERTEAPEIDHHVFTELKNYMIGEWDVLVLLVWIRIFEY